MAIIPGDAGKNIVIDTPQKQKSRNLLYLLVAIALIAAAVLYFGYGNSQQPSLGVENPLGNAPGSLSATQQQQIDQSNKVLEALSTISLNSAIFADKKFQSLILSEKLPVVVGEKGRSNPFDAF